jgi:hypothetical protein
MTILTIEVLKKFFLWMTIINFGLLTFYFLFFISAKRFIYKLHKKWFKISEEKMYSTLYKVLAFYKIATIAFNLVPYIALVIIM